MRDPRHLPLWADNDTPWPAHSRQAIDRVIRTATHTGREGY